MSNVKNASNLVSLKKYAEDKEIWGCVLRHMRKVDDNIGIIANLLTSVDVDIAYKIVLELKTVTEVALILIEKNKLGG